MKEMSERQQKSSSNTMTFLRKKCTESSKFSSFLYTVPFKLLDEINLQHSEMLVNKPLYDVSNQIKNIQKERPHHVDKSIKKSTISYYNSF